MIEARGQNGCGGLWAIVVFFSLTFFLAPNVLPITLPLALLLILVTLGASKRILLTAEGCMVKTLFFKRFYRWSQLQTIRYIDFEKYVLRSQGPDYKHRGKYRTDYGTAILFSTRKLGRYPNTDPDTYLLLHDPFCLSSFYIHLLPENDFFEWSEGYRKTAFYPYPVKREEFISRAQEWGLKIDGLTIPERQAPKK